MSLYGDELTIVYDAYSILKTGKDQTGQSFPLTFRMGAGRPAGYVYGSIPFVAIFGPSFWGVRGLSLLSGVGIIILMYFLGKKLFNQKIGLISSFLTSISLWDIYLSRGGFEAHFALFLALLGIVSFLNKKYLIWAITWGVTILTYPTFKVTLPVLFLVLLWYGGFKKIIKNKIFAYSLVVLLIFAGISIKETLGGVSEERFSRINVFSSTRIKEQLIQKINEERNLSVLPKPINLFLYNKPLTYSRTILENYFENISPQFLYFRGDGNPRHNPGEWGMLYLIELPLLFVAFYHLFQSDKKKALMLLKWILIVPLAPMFLPESAHGLRNDLLIPPFLLLSSYAFTKIPKKFAIIGSLAIAIQFTFVMFRIYFFAPYKFGSFWSEEAYKASQKAINEKENYESVVLSTDIDNIEYAYPVYAKIDPNLVISQYGKFPKTYGNVIISDKTEEFEKQSVLFIK